MNKDDVSPIEYVLPEHVMEQHRMFLHQYRKIRKGEGRGSEDYTFYLQLPEGAFSGRRKSEWRMRAQSLRWLEEHLTAHKKYLTVLDAGAGNCWMTRYMAEWGHDVTALDINDDGEDGLAAGRHYLEHLPVRFRRVVADFDGLPFEREQFDVVIFNGAIHYSSDVPGTIAEAERCLKPGGEIILIDTPLYRSEASGERMLAERHEAGRARYLTFAMLEESAAMCGLNLALHQRPGGLLQSLKRRLAERLRGREFASMPWVVLRKSL